MKIIHKLFTMLCAVALLCVASGSLAKESLETRAALNHFQAAPQTQPFFQSAYGYAVFPSVGKGGFWIGGAYGTGSVYQAHQLTGTASLFQLSVGLQFGGQAYSELIFFQDQRAYERFINGSVELDAQASAVAINEGAQAKAGTAGFSASSGKDSYIDANYTNGIAVFTFAKGGMMVEASLAGQTFRFEPLTPATGHASLPASSTHSPAQTAPVSVMVDTIEPPVQYE